MGTISIYEQNVMSSVKKNKEAMTLNSQTWYSNVELIYYSHFVLESLYENIFTVTQESVIVYHYYAYFITYDFMKPETS